MKVSPNCRSLNERVLDLRKTAETSCYLYWCFTGSLLATLAKLSDNSSLFLSLILARTPLQANMLGRVGQHFKRYKSEKRYLPNNGIAGKRGESKTKQNPTIKIQRIIDLGAVTIHHCRKGHCFALSTFYRWTTEVHTFTLLLIML